jgi:flagellar basal-body rod protein FlgB
MLNKIDQELAFTQTALALRARRQEVLAANLANADTPNYKARDLDFAAALKSAVGATGSVGLARTAAGHLPAAGAAGPLAAAALQYRATVQPSLDGNTVDVDVERAHFAENSMQYQFLLSRLSATVQKMKTALAGER